MIATIKGNTLTVVIDLNNDPQPSSTGKTRIAAYDSVKLPAAFKGKELKVALTATIKND